PVPAPPVPVVCEPPVPVVSAPPAPVVGEPAAPVDDVVLVVELVVRVPPWPPSGGPPSTTSLPPQAATKRRIEGAIDKDFMVRSVASTGHMATRPTSHHGFSCSAIKRRTRAACVLVGWAARKPRARLVAADDAPVRYNASTRSTVASRLN